MKLGKFFRNAVTEKLKKDIEKSDSLFVLRYSSLSSPQMTLLRYILKQEGKSSLLVSKNSLIRRALKDARIEGLDSFCEGPTALVFGLQDIARISKLLTKFAKENQNLILKGAYYQGSVLKPKDIESIAKLPSKDVLIAQAVSAIKAPLTGLVWTLQGILNKLVVVLGQIKDKKK